MYRFASIVHAESQAVALASYRKCAGISGARTIPARRRRCWLDAQKHSAGPSRSRGDSLISSMPCAANSLQLGIQIGHFQADMMQARSALRQVAGDATVLVSRLDQFQPRFADLQEGDIDPPRQRWSAPLPPPAIPLCSLQKSSASRRSATTRGDVIQAEASPLPCSPTLLTSDCLNGILRGKMRKSFALLRASGAVY